MLNLRQYKKIISKYYPDYRKQFKSIENEITQTVGSCKRFLDAGCGTGYHTIKFGKNAKLLVGIDIDKQKINEAERKYGRKNVLFLVGNIEKTKFRNGYFDIIFCQFVIEHLINVEKIFKEFSRLLKKDGKLIIITSNIFDPQNFLNRIIPSFIKSFIKKKLGIVINLQPIFYRCNCVSKLDRFAKRYSMKRIKIYRTGSPMFFQSNRLLLRAWIFFDKIIDNLFFQFLKSTIYCIYEKE